MGAPPQLLKHSTQVKLLLLKYLQSNLILCITKSKLLFTSGQTTCTPCKLDSVTAEKGSFSCMSCSYGFYSPEVGGMECLICPLRASYQPPSCPPVIPNCPKISISNQYGNYNTTSDVEPIVGKGIPQTFECQFGVRKHAA